jgi:ATP-dependent DNA helicase PIF1
MVDGDLFDKLARIGSILRKKTEPFGGIQVRVLSTSARLF